MPTFPLSARLSESLHYTGVFTAPRIRVSTSSFLLLATPSTVPRSRLGVVVAKKNVRKANRRHRLKRIIREHFRLCQPSSALDLVVLARSSADQLTNPQVWCELKTLWLALDKKAAAL